MENTGALTYNDSVKTNKKNEAILGRLEGPCADCISSTRNGRKYSDKLWTKVFSNPIVKETIDNGGIVGEFGHPLDGRTEVEPEKIAIIMPEVPERGKDGLLIGKFDILDTPNGRILNCLCKYGYKIGISSRGSGDVIESFTGEEEVDPESFEFSCFDAVLVPSVKAARMKYESLTESLNNESNVKKALTEAYDNSSEDDKKIMKETLNSLNIDLTSKEDIDDVVTSNDAVDSIKANMVDELQEALKENQQLQNQLKELHEKLSVSYTKEATLNEELSRYKKATASLSESVKRAKALKERVRTLERSLSDRDDKINQKEHLIESYKVESKEKADTNKSLNESIVSHKEKIALLESKNKNLSEKFNNFKKQSELDKINLTEELNNLKADVRLKQSEYTRKLAKSNNLVEHYKKIANTAVDKYIDLQAVKLGITSKEIKNRLEEGYTFSDIDSICEELQSYKLNISRLPFDISRNNTNTKVEVKESKEPITEGLDMQYDDCIDDDLLILAGLK